MSDSKTLRDVDPANAQMPSEDGPLAAYAGKSPEAPDWFMKAVAAPYETHFVEVDGTQVHYQSWGEPTAPGLLLVHGNGAHAHWWDFIAPFFTETYHVVAATFSGMGDSAWRTSYDMAGFVRQLHRVAQDAGLLAHEAKPVTVAHSFGGFVSLGLAERHGDLFERVIIVDSPIRPPDEPHRGPPRSGRPNKVYPSLETALARFRLAPPQPCENHYAMDYIARHSLKEAPHHSGATGWSWKFDPTIWTHFDFDKRPEEVLARAQCPVDFIRGADSLLVTDRVYDYMAEIAPQGTQFLSIPGAHHHVMLDQPLAFVDVLKRMLKAGAR